ncbi:DUF885 domain-containing protein [Agrococcus sediminis]|uniref:DUF885 domain-containing protein n=1 Tax=Agrococcus sediminis TaxID=2599924 RepID=A0A5M8QF48_9MICO|nr:DUF885 domain-containing protein [Agrococcus sediminis]KAA6433731.1 DUF885 domain-containing protein [Agrococcus sediminis]RWR21026.1 DUF885 domain-containing protein [Agrococcus lahaulensis]
MTDETAGAPSRPQTEIDRIAEAYVHRAAALNPEINVYVGLEGDKAGYGDYSPEGRRADAELARETLAALQAAEPADDVDWVTKTDLSRELQLELDVEASGWGDRDLNNLASPASGIRDIFDLMSTATEDDWSTIAERMRNVPAAIDGYIASLRNGIATGNTPAARQIDNVLEQFTDYAPGKGFFHEFAGSAKAGEAELPESLRSDLAAAAGEATEAHARLAEFLRSELAASANPVDAVGREFYSLMSRRFLGAEVDLDETYAWGIEELERMRTEQEAIAHEIKPGASVQEAIAFLDQDASRKLHGTDALKAWMQATSDRAIEELGRSHFDIAEPITALECMIAPTQTGGIYYTGPSDDFSRPGRMWWSVPEGVTEFDTWRELTTVYHEGVPGHHLQIAQATYNRKQLNLWRRAFAGTSGHAEGWALYAERLMESLGYLDDPADRLGMLDGQRMRAARVVLDIGVHLGKPRLDGTGEWDFDYAFEFMRSNVNMNEPFVRFEVNRYFGWPGQAPSYKIGQRIFEQIRDAAKDAEGDAFDLKRFHMRVLNIGGVGLDTLREAVLRGA